LAKGCRFPEKKRKNLLFTCKKKGEVAADWFQGREKKKKRTKVRGIRSGLCAEKGWNWSREEKKKKGGASISLKKKKEGSGLERGCNR